MGYVTREMIDRAKEMDLLTYLRTYEPQELVHFGGSTYCTREHDSLKISNGKWCWFSRGIGGRTALDYLIKVKEVPFTEAVERIVGRAAERPPISYTCQQPKQTKTLLLPQASRCATHAVEYLHSRGIDYELIDFCIRTGRLYESYPYHNVVFVGKDKDGQPRYACLRGIGTDFKGEATGSDKRFSFSIPAEEPSPVLYLFESAIDLLSFATMAQADNLPWRSQHLLSLAGVYQPKKNLTERHLPLALSRYLRDHREIQTIYLCLDNDLAGRSAADAIRQQLAGRYVVRDGFPRQGKDYNDTSWRCQYHVVFAPKYRRMEIYGKIKEDIGIILRKLCQQKSVEIIEAQACPDHIHMLISIPPKYSVSQIMGYLKGKSSLMIFDRHANLKYKYGNRHFWARGYFVDTVGRNKKAIKAYIQNQLEEDKMSDQISIKEFIDPFTSSKNPKA